MNKIIGIFCTVIFLSSCWNDEKAIEQPLQTISADDLINMHKQLIKAEDLLIKKYIAENNLVVKTTGTGLRYLINIPSNGSKIEIDNKVVVKYSREILLKDSSKTEPANYGFVVGKSNEIPTGVHEGIQLMKVGEQATFILPPHLGYGITGEQNLGIPPKAILVYNIEVLSAR